MSEDQAEGLRYLMRHRDEHGFQADGDPVVGETFDSYRDKFTTPQVDALLAISTAPRRIWVNHTNKNANTGTWHSLPGAVTKDQVEYIMSGLDHANSRPIESVPGLNLAAVEMKP